jgi:hypothetical protein
VRRGPEGRGTDPKLFALFFTHARAKRKATNKTPRLELFGRMGVGEAAAGTDAQVLPKPGEVTYYSEAARAASRG